jgi:hypothetical protein
MPVLQFLDVAIGYILAILLAATLTGAIVQAIQTLASVRQRRLRDGLQALIASLDPALSTEAASLAKTLTTSARARVSDLAAERLGREEFILLLLRQAADTPAGALAKAVKDLTGKDADDLLKSIQDLLLRKEAEDPRAPAYLWKVRAFTEAGCGRLAGRIFAWYDHTMDRVEDRVTFNARLLAAIVAFGVCMGLNLDSIGLLKRLSRDEKFRAALVERAIDEIKNPRPAADPAATKESLKGVLSLADETRALIVLPSAQPAAPPDPSTGTRHQIFGLLISWAMVSLGAPFWFGLLNQALGLRSVLAQKLEQQRKHRDADGAAA